MRDAAVDHLQLYLKLAKEASINAEILGKLISSLMLMIIRALLC